MEWQYIDKRYLTRLECCNPDKGKYFLRLTANPRMVIITGDEEAYKFDTRFILKYLNFNPTLDDVKEILLSLQAEYDSSDEVNKVIINGNPILLDKLTRLELINVLNIKKERGDDITEIWFGDVKFQTNIDTAIYALNTIELYAYECYNTTRNHIEEIKNLSTLKDALEYDITAGYPALPNIHINISDNSNNLNQSLIQ